MPRPSPTLLRELTDERVLRALLSAEAQTRAQLAVLTGLSKPTVGESVRRLVAAGLLADTGEVTRGRGGVGTFYALAPDAGVALAVAIAPEGVVVEAVDAAGAVLSRVERTVEEPEAVQQLLLAAVQEVLTSAPGPIRVAVVSAADPVDRATGKLVQLPDSPFRVGALSPAECLGPLVAGPVVVDNDVNWAAAAERESMDGAPADFVYLYLGEGLGCALVADGEVRRGHAGLAGEISHVVVEGADGRGRPLIEVFAELGLRRPGTTAIDVGRLLTAVQDASVSAVLARAVSGLISGAVAFLDPQFVVLGGAWGSDPAVLRSVRTELAGLARPVRVEGPQAGPEPSLAGARARARTLLREALVDLTVSRATVTGRA